MPEARVERPQKQAWAVAVAPAKETSHLQRIQPGVEGIRGEEGRSGAKKPREHLLHEQRAAVSQQHQGNHRLLHERRLQKPHQPL